MPSLTAVSPRLIAPLGRFAGWLPVSPGRRGAFVLPLRQPQCAGPYWRSSRAQDRFRQIPYLAIRLQSTYARPGHSPGGAARRRLASLEADGQIAAAPGPLFPGRSGFLSVHAETAGSASGGAAAGERPELIGARMGGFVRLKNTRRSPATAH